MELRQLRHFVALAEHRNFSRAAEQLHIAQPALSISIRNLEQEIGARLFERGPRHVALTDAGVQALSSAREALSHAEEVTRVAATAENAGELRVAFVGSATHKILPRFLPVFRRRYADIELELSEGPSLEVIDRVRSGLADAGIVRHPVMQPTGLDMRVLDREHLLAAFPRKHPLASKAKLRLKDLCNEPFIQYSHIHAPSMNTVISLACQRNGFEPKVAQEAIQIHTILSLVECGLGIALVPMSSRAPSGQKVEFRSVSDSKDLLTVGLALVVNPTNKRPLLRAFVDLLIQCGEDGSAKP
jgi:DNA-binding transcriptional LysR family regulator